MTNTVMTAKNTFAEGLVMDFAPDNTQATTLTSALNATLLTFNGNEMSLLNDMGNGRVETAYLPEGYIPVGTCEFGDIIYIVSYNPLINKSLIGCFPSPERNISSEEIGDLNLSIKWTDFQKSNDAKNPSGELVASSVKKILYESKDMTSGDKYIIYSKEIDLEGMHLSDYGNTSHLHNRFPKLVKIHVVSIEESGKITYLDSSTKWYKGNNFYIQNQKEILDKPDLDSYRTMVSSAYSIFSSKVSGKLALLIELEKISGFSCTWSAYTLQQPYVDDILNNKYSIYWNFSWNTTNFNINPSCIVLTESKWTGEDNTNAGRYLTWEYDDVEKGWALGGSKLLWKDINIKPIAYPLENYLYNEISRIYKPENYENDFDQFIKEDSYYVQHIKLLSMIKTSLLLPLVTKLTKVNLDKADNYPKEGYYYFNCTSTAVKDNKIIYYTNVNNGLKEIQSTLVSDDIINNTFNYPITKKFTDFDIPIKLKVKYKVELKEVEEEKNININNLIYYYELTPAMPYGLLREFSLDGYIDFKKIGTKSIKLNTWKYFNYENTSTLTWGLEAYTEPNKGISEVVFIFYDNQGPAAAYHSTGKNSYNGKFTEYFTLNTSGTNYKLNNIGINKKDLFYHKGLSIYKESAIVSETYLTKEGNKISKEAMQNGVEYFTNDAGTLYSNCLYLVKIIIKYCSSGALGEYIEDETSYIEDYRWYWTNVMFNDYYYSVLDFKDLLFNLNLDCLAVFETVKDKWEIKKTKYYTRDNYEESISNLDVYKSLSANVLYVNLDNSLNNNLRMAVRAGLLHNYNTFNILESGLSNISTRIFLAKESLKNFPELPNIKFTEKNTTIFLGIYPTLAEKLTGEVDSSTSNTLNTKVESIIVGTGEELYDSLDAYKNYTNNFKIYPSTTSEKIGNSTNGLELIYIDSSTGEEVSTSEFEVFKTSLANIYYNETSSKIEDSRSFSMTLKGIHYSKYYYSNMLDSNPVKKLKSFITSADDKLLDAYALGINYDTKKILYNRIFLCSNRVMGNSDSGYLGAVVSFNGSNLTKVIDTSGRKINDDLLLDIHVVFSDSYNIINNNFKFMFPQGFGHDSDGDSWQRATKEGQEIAENTEIWVGKNYSDFDLGGTLVGITNKGTIEPGDHMNPHNSLTAYMPVVLGYLTLLFYLTTDLKESKWYYPYNYAYLEDNYSLYNKDIVIELMSSLDNNNTLLVFNGWDYSIYLEQVLNNALLSLDKWLIELNNVNLKLNGCLRTCPLLLKIPYITPETNNIIKNKVVIDTIYSDIPTTSGLSFSEGVIYCYDTINDYFTNVSAVNTLKKLDNYIINEKSISTSLSSNKNTFNINSIKKLLTIIDNYIAMVLTPPVTSNKYLVCTVKESGRHGSKFLSNYSYGLKYFE